MQKNEQDTARSIPKLLSSCKRVCTVASIEGQQGVFDARNVFGGGLRFSMRVLGDYWLIYGLCKCLKFKLGVKNSCKFLWLLRQLDIFVRMNLYVVFCKTYIYGLGFSTLNFVALSCVNLNFVVQKFMVLSFIEILV